MICRLDKKEYICRLFLISIYIYNKATIKIKKVTIKKKDMNKKFLIPSVIIVLLLIGGIAYLSMSLHKERQENKEMQELAEMDKKEMENEYQQFADQYSEMKSKINNDSLVAQLTQEQLKTQELLKELKSVKSNDAREIARLKKDSPHVEP